MSISFPSFFNKLPNDEERQGEEHFDVVKDKGGNGKRKG
jgi:hypothetical protein